MTSEMKNAWAAELEGCLRDNILPYWLEWMADPEGGFYGRRDGNDVLHPEADRGAVLNARILWTFAAAWRQTGDDRYMKAAREAYRYFEAHFIDQGEGGVYWSVKSDGTPADDRKQFYAIAFAIYAYAEFYRATGEAAVLERAMEAIPRRRRAAGSRLPT